MLLEKKQHYRNVDNMFVRSMSLGILHKFKEKKKNIEL